jgi:uncharacterized membrane protein YfcA
VTLELGLFGLITGFVSGFFGVGGGMVLVPMLLWYGFDMKQSVSISIMQMVFSSIFGSFLNSKKYTSLLKDGTIIGLGGFIGGFQSGYVHQIVSNKNLEYLFILIVILAIYKISTSKIIEEQQTKQHSKIALFFIGLVIGIIAMSIGVGGSIMLTPILVSYLYYNLKDASSMGLFFVVFSSFAGFISLSYYGNMLYTEGIIVGLLSLFGVYFGVKLKNQVNIISYKKLILTLYVFILISVVVKLIF